MASANLEEVIELLEKYNPTFAYKRRLQIITFAFRTFVAGVQYSIVLASAWKYLQALGAETWLYGIAIGAFPATALMLSPVVGVIYDRTKRAKEILTVLNVIALIGNLIYSLPYSPWLPVIGRSLSGIGELGRVVAFGEIGWTVRKQHRIGITAYVLAPFVVGILLGPPISLASKNVDLHIGRWHIDYRNAPGIFGIFLWLIMQLLTQFMIGNVARDYVLSSLEESNADTSKFCHENASDTKLNEVFPEEKMTDVSRQSENNEPDTNRTWISDLKALSSFEIMAIYLAKLLNCLLMYEGDTIVPLVTQEDFGWSVVNTSLVYACAALCVTISFVILGLIGKWISDIKALLAMLISCTIGAIFIVVYHFFRGSKIVGHVIFFVGIVLIFIVDCLDESATVSLLSKVVPASVRGRAQSIGVMMSLLGNTVGPIWGSLYFRNILVFGSLNVAFGFVSLVCFIVSIKRLNNRVSLYSDTI